MKICVISTPVFTLGKTGLGGYGGLEQIAWQCAKGLAAKGHKVYLVAPDGSECPGVEILPIGLARTVDEEKAYNHYWPKLLEVDAVLDHSWGKFSYLLKGEGRMPNTPILGVWHAPVKTMYQQAQPPSVEKPCFVFISEDQRLQFEQIHERPGRTCYNGVDLDYYRPLEGIPRSKRFLFLARFSFIKGPHIGINACRQVGAPLDLIGDTSITSEPEYFQDCRSKCDGKQIRMVGPASRGECVWWLSQAHCLLHGNRYFREPFGLAPVEAMACGVPVIAFDYGAMRETIKNNETGWLVKTEEEFRGCIVAAMQEKGDGPLVPITDATRARCREWASQFSEQRMVDRYEQLILEARDTGGW